MTKALAAFLMVCGIGAAHAAEAPDNVEAEIADAVQSCKDQGGTPNTDAVLSVSDVNGDWWRGLDRRLRQAQLQGWHQRYVRR
jgi:hypothetical protein